MKSTNDHMREMRAISFTSCSGSVVKNYQVGLSKLQTSISWELLKSKTKYILFLFLILILPMCKSPEKLNKNLKSKEFKEALQAPADEQKYIQISQSDFAKNDSSNKEHNNTGQLAATNDSCIPEEALEVITEGLIKDKYGLYTDGIYSYSFKLVTPVPNIVKEVFPDVIFYEVYKLEDFSQKGILSSYFMERVLTPSFMFNQLFEAQNSSKSKFEKKVEVLFCIIEGFDKNVKLISIYDISEKDQIETSDQYKVLIDVNGSVNEYLLISNGDIIKKIERFENNSYQPYLFLNVH